MKIYFLFTLLFIMENNEKKQKVNKIVDLIGFFFLNLQRKILNIKVMKKIILMFLMMLIPIYMFPTSVTCLYYKWHTKQRSLSSSSLSWM